jgi:hypothetical protein
VAIDPVVNAVPDFPQKILKHEFPVITDIRPAVAAVPDGFTRLLIMLPQIEKPGELVADTRGKLVPVDESGDILPGQAYVLPVVFLAILRPAGAVCRFLRM